MSISLSTFGAAFLHATHPNDDRLHLFHERAHLTTATHGTASHVALGVVVWVCHTLEQGLQVARDILEHVPEVSIALSMGEPELTITGQTLLPVGLCADLVIQQCQTIGAGMLATHSSMSDTSPLTEAGWTHNAHASPWTMWLLSAFTETSHLRAEPQAQENPQGALSSAMSVAEIVEFVEQSMRDLDSGQSLERLTVLERSQALILETISTTVSPHPEACARLLTALARWLHPIWTQPEALKACETLVGAWPLADASPESLPLYVDVHMMRARQLHNLRDLEEARHLLETITSVTEEHSTAHGRALNALARHAVMCGDVEEALSLYQRVLNTFGDDALLPVVARAHRGLAMALRIHTHELDHDQASSFLFHLERSIDIAGLCNDRQTNMLSLSMWANHMSKVDPEHALERTKTAITLAHKLGLRHLAASSMFVWLDIAIRQGRMNEARSVLTNICDELPDEDRVGHWIALYKEAFICLYEGDHDHASTIAHALHQDAALRHHPQFPTMLDTLDMYRAVLGGQYEQFTFLSSSADLTRHPPWPSPPTSAGSSTPTESASTSTTARRSTVSSGRSSSFISRRPPARDAVFVRGRVARRAHHVRDDEKPCVCGDLPTTRFRPAPMARSWPIWIRLHARSVHRDAPQLEHPHILRRFKMIHALTLLTI